MHAMTSRGAPVRILVVPDGAAERLPSDTSSAARQHHDTESSLANIVTHTSLELASTPVLDELARAQGVGRVRTIPRGFQPGTETGLLSLLGYRLQQQIGRAGLMQLHSVSCHDPARQRGDSISVKVTQVLHR